MKIELLSGRIVTVSQKQAAKLGIIISVMGLFPRKVAYFAGMRFGYVLSFLLILLLSHHSMAGGDKKTWKKTVASACKVDSGFKRFFYGGRVVYFKDCLQFKKRKVSKRGIR